MPPKFYKKRRTYRRRGPLKGYKKRNYQRKARKMTKFTNIKKNLYYFKRKVLGTQQPASNSQWSYAFALNAIPNHTELTQLFDQYMITGIKVSWRLIYDPQAAPFINATYPNLYVRKDYDNTQTESAVEIMQDNKSKRFILHPNRVYSVFLRPSTLYYHQSVDNQGNEIKRNEPMWKHWLDCADANVPHYGIKCALDTMGAAIPSQAIQTEFTYYVACKNTR